MYRELSSLHNEIMRLFTWAPDSETFGEIDHWQEFSDSVELGNKFTGDCDDFALTCLVVGIRRGLFQPEVCRVARVATEVCPSDHLLDHAVAIIGDYMLDNRQRKPIKLSDANQVYRFYDYAKIPIIEWYLYSENNV